MKIIVLGACGTFMAGLVVLARELGHSVTAYDKAFYPPMSTQLEHLGVEIKTDEQLQLDDHDLVIIGNCLSRGHTWVDQTLNANIPYISGPQWIAEHVLARRHVIAVSGTHGKTTTSSMIVWVLRELGMMPGYLIGGQVKGFESSAALGQVDQPFVIEADEYDSAFFDKRAKFVHYGPKTLIINNLEHDHCDIYPTMHEILNQFKILIKLVPDYGKIIHSARTPSLNKLLKENQHCDHLPILGNKNQWWLDFHNTTASSFSVMHADDVVCKLDFTQVMGRHNAENALAALLALHDVGVDMKDAAQLLSSFRGVVRRLQKHPNQRDIHVYEDFAHHPTAMLHVVETLKARHPKSPIKVLLQLGSFTQRSGLHWQEIGKILAQVNGAWILRPQFVSRDLDELLAYVGSHGHLFNDVVSMLANLKKGLAPGDVVVSMSSRDFQGLHSKLDELLRAGVNE